jgi:RHS repeat-associated protein
MRRIVGCLAMVVFFLASAPHALAAITITETGTVTSYDSMNGSSPSLVNEPFQITIVLDNQLFQPATCSSGYTVCYTYEGNGGTTSVTIGGQTTTQANDPYSFLGLGNPFASGGYGEMETDTGIFDAYTSVMNTVLSDTVLPIPDPFLNGNLDFTTDVMSGIVTLNGWSGGCNAVPSQCDANIKASITQLTITTGSSAALALNFGGSTQLADASGPQSVAGTPGDGCTSTCEPVNTGTGDEFEREVDLAGAPSTGISLTRYYNSQDSSQTPFGTGWHDTWHRGITNINLSSGGTSSVTVTAADGRQEVFTENSSGQWIGQPNVTSHLAALMNGSELLGWQLTLADDTVEMYLPNGLLSTITTRAGLTTTLAYDGSGNLLTVTGPFGHRMSFTYDTSNPPRVIGMIAPDGGHYAYAYDGNDNLVLVTYPDGSQRQYLYENTAAPNELTGIIDEDGNRYVTIAYDGSGRAISTQFAGGADLTTITYNSDGSTTVTDANGNSHTFTYTNNFGLVQMATLTGAPVPSVGGNAFTYDSNGFLASKTDFDGNVTTFTHDALGNELSRTQANGTSLARTYSATWLPNYHLPSLVTEPNGRVTNFTYDSHGNLLTKTVTAGNESREWQWTYNSAGKVLTATDPDGNVTSYTYNAQGEMASETDALGHKTVFTSYDGAGRLLSMTDPNGLVTQLAYDPRGRLISRNIGGEITSLDYDLAGNLIKLTMPDSSFKSFVYDQAHRLTHIFDALNNQLAFTLDGNGNRTNASAYDPSGNLTQTRSFAYDDVNRLLKEIGAEGQITSYDHDPEGNLLSATDPLGDETQFSFDALNRRIQSINALGGNTLYAYNIVDDLAAEVDPRSLKTGYSFDGLDNQTQTASPDAGTTNRTFDEAGNVLTSTDARGDETRYSYDSLNRVTEALYADGSKSLYQYDQGTNGIGHLTHMIDPSGETSWGYDQHGQVIEKDQVTFDKHFLVRYGYDSGGRLIGMTYPSGDKNVSLSYDIAGNVSAVYAGGSPIATSIIYRPFGPIESYRQGNGGNYIRSFDLDGRITGITMGGIPVQYVYDEADRITEIAEKGFPNDGYAYDGLNRLTGYAEGSEADLTAWSYDANGNRLAQTEPTPLLSSDYSIATSSNRLLEEITGKDAITHQFTYDASGNLLEDAATGIDPEWNTGLFAFDNPGTDTGKHELLFTYDARGRMASVVATKETDDPHGHVLQSIERKTEYAINGLGERTAKYGEDRFGWLDQQGGAVNYVYDEQGHLIGEYDARGNRIEEIVYLGDLPIAVFKDGVGGAGTYFISADNIGAPHIVTDARGRMVWEWHHKPFGNSEPVSVAGFELDLRLPGQVHDRETGLNYNLMRDYNAKLGRYVQSDPIGLLGGLNGYGYVGQNPLWAFDADGLLELFGFGAYEGETPTPIARVGGEAIGIIGYNTDTGGYTAVIGAVGGHIGGEANYFGGAFGKEVVTSGEAQYVQNISLEEGSFGLELPFLLGAGLGGGSYQTGSEYGIYIYANGGILGEHATLGFGFPISGIVNDIESLLSQFDGSFLTRVGKICPP